MHCQSVPPRPCRDGSVGQPHRSGAGRNLLANRGFAVQSLRMDTQRAAEHLQVIRTLMERAALYRRALAPIMLAVGLVGCAAGAFGTVHDLKDMRAFGVYWLAVAFAAVALAFVLARRQALKDREPFWSPPTRRVAQALLPALVSGFCLAVVLTLGNDEEMILFMVLLCLFFYGAAVHAAGFFMPRGMKVFGWLFIAGGVLLLAGLMVFEPDDLGPRPASAVMGLFFGVVHVGYGLYLRATERAQPVA
jgi:hypothetical protein